ncbi:type VII secretion protein EccE [Mycolicibacter hiberniae]|uniref:ESX-3 secretion system protein EccE3 n=1 Tax=Mycolicibacter hiberniae TaxID=29314 RepID=A0A7I7X3V0_9MYCO|nr:type VII secretion protein EccE [Mycolicibacter hiberniae]MCV7084246.1 type VII secretion protein EccE [Mycolicibacter hiberniae]ORV73142.1 type VII secretion protein EccE [Mycolicibacter hiberniae]BBZ23411.1 ESX-3 secretion system protein EccE3 [Mycolicibacter hiberniae]
MSTHRSSSPGTGRITLVLFVAVAAATAYPWQTARERWVLGIGLAVVAVALARRRGLPVTTLLRRWATIKRPKRGVRRARRPGTEARVTALLAVAAPAEDPDLLPLPLIAGYLDRYGLHADAIRVTSRDVGDHAGTRERATWIGLTFSAVDNLAALQARSPEIPLHQTAAVAARRLADHLREAGWVATPVEPDDIPRLDAAGSRETWHAVVQENGDHLAAYRVTSGQDVSDLLSKVWAYPTPETWTVLEISGSGDEQTLALATAFRTGAPPSPGGPLSGLGPQVGNHRASLAALHPSSGQRLDGHAAAGAQWLSPLRWPSTTAQRLAADAAAS